MSLPDDPRRLLEDPTENVGDLGLGLEKMASNLPSADVLARMATRLGVTPSGAPANGHGATPKTLAKIAGGAGISGVVLWAILRASSPEPAVAPLPPSAVAPPSPVEVSVPPVPLPKGAAKANERASTAPGSRDESAPPGAEPNAAVPAVPPGRTTETPDAPPPSDVPRGAERPRATEPTEPPRTATPIAPRTSRPTPAGDVTTPPAKAPAASAPTETALLRDARLALNGDPAQALVLTEQHRREYPNGAFSQEREVIAITALARLGRTSEARSRAERFRNAYPSSPYTERVDRAVPR